MNEEEITQYNQCSEDWRHYDRAIWQMPTVTITIASGIMAVAYEYVNDFLPRAVILFLGGLLLLSITVALVKHRVFQEQRTEFLLVTEKDWVASVRVKRTIKRKTDEIPQLPWHKKRKGFYWLRNAMIITTAFLFGLSIYNFYLILGSALREQLSQFSLLSRFIAMVLSLLSLGVVEVLEAFRNIPF